MNRLHRKTSGVVLGGDLRQIHLANCLCENMSVSITGIDAADELLSPNVNKLITDSDCCCKPDFLFLPMPVMNGDCINAPMCTTTISVAQALVFVGQDTLVFGGKIDPPLKQKFTQQGITFYDYLNREELAVMNAIATAEGTIEIILREIPVTIFGLNIMIVGSGRISKTLRKNLVAMGAHVSVSGRKPEDNAWITIDGCTPINHKDLGTHIGHFDVIINTVPTKILDEKTLSRIDSSALLIDLASKPGGVDFDMANILGIRTIWALSLPGKTAPISSGQIIYQTICNIIEEEIA